jgi:hypothetical protein
MSDVRLGIPPYSFSSSPTFPQPPAGQLGRAAKDVGLSILPFVNIPLDLSVDRTTTPYPLVMVGDFVELNDTTNASDKIRIAFGTIQGPYRWFYRGSSFGGPTFNRLFIFHSAIVGARAEIIVAKQFPGTTPTINAET